MDRLCRLATVAFAVFATVVAPLPAPSATVTPPAPIPPPNHRVTYTYKTFLDPATVDYTQIRKFNVDFRTLTLTFNPDKAIRGTYKPDFSNPTTVTGGLTGGGHLRLQIDNRHFTGRFTPRGIAAFTPTASGSSWRLWGQFVHA